MSRLRAGAFRLSLSFGMCCRARKVFLDILGKDYTQTQTQEKNIKEPFGHIHRLQSRALRNLAQGLDFSLTP